MTDKNTPKTITLPPVVYRRVKFLARSLQVSDAQVIDRLTTHMLNLLRSGKTHADMMPVTR